MSTQPFSMSESITELMPALHAAQGSLKPAQKGSANPHFRSRYADLSDVWEACAEPLHANKLTATYALSPNGQGGTDISLILFHVSGQWIRSSLQLQADLRKPQEVGSAITYYRRYLLAALLAIPTTDDDGEAAMKRGHDSHERQQSRSSRPEASRRQEPARQQNMGYDTAAWDELSRRILSVAIPAWRDEMDREGVPKERREDLTHENRLLNDTTSKALKGGLVAMEEIEKPGADGIRDNLRSRAALARLVRENPERVEAFIEGYLEKKRNELRPKLGMFQAFETQEAGARG